MKLVKMNQVHWYDEKSRSNTELDRELKGLGHEIELKYFGENVLNFEAAPLIS